MRRSSTIALPREAKNLFNGFAIICRLPNVLSISVREQGIEVVRDVDEGDDVIPESVAQILAGAQPEPADFEFMMSNLTAEPLPFDKERHPLITVMEMFSKLSAQDLTPCIFWAPRGDWVAAFFGLPSNETPPSLFGVPVNYVGAEQLEGKLVLVGGLCSSPVFATYAVIADIGDN